jgi:hypothetical protein
MSVLDPSLTRTQLMSIWRTLDPSNLGSVELNSVYSILSAKYGKDKGKCVHLCEYVCVLRIRAMCRTQCILLSAHRTVILLLTAITSITLFIVLSVPQSAQRQAVWWTGCSQRSGREQGAREASRASQGTLLSYV